MPGKTIRDMHPHGILDPAGVLRVSSNIGAAKIALRARPGRHYDALRALRLRRGRAAAGFPDESAGVLRPWKRWRPVDHATIAFGQGVSVTPIQLAAAFGAFANGGVWHVRRAWSAARRAPGGAWQPAEPSRPAAGVMRPRRPRRCSA